MTSAEDPNFERAHANLMNNTCDLRVEFVKRMMEVKSKMVWDDEKLTDVKDRDDSPSMNEDDDKGEGFIEDYITPGGIIRLPVNTHTKSIRAMYVRQKNEEKSSYVRSMQKKLCQVLSLCDQVSTVNIDITKTQDLYGYSYIELKINEDARSLLNATSIDFELQIEIDNKQLVRKRFSLNCPAKRQKRADSYTDSYKPWGSWYYRSIGHERYFPDYEQHMITKGGKRCPVGSAAVAWAMVFGYYDRRSHYRTSTYGNGSQTLYGCSKDGAYWGSGCVAPKYARTSRIRTYIHVINYKLRSICGFYTSVTYASYMRNVQSFYQVRQKSGKPRILQTNAVWTDVLKWAHAKQTMKWIDAGWPVVVGTNHFSTVINFLSHYSVATKYRTRIRSWRRCYHTRNGTFCGIWHTGYSWQMYVHQGLGYGSTKWRDMNIHYAAVAVY